MSHRPNNYSDDFSIRPDAAASFALAIHGGAGTIDRASLSKELERDYRNALMAALEAGRQVLAEAGSALDAVQASVVALEDCPLFNAGRGAVFTAEGNTELDAAIMCGRTLNCGGVIGVTGVRNPIGLARRVMENTPHVLLQGSGADSFARSCGIEMMDAAYFHTDYRWQQLLQARASGQVLLDHESPLVTAAHGSAGSEPSLGTVGAVARDIRGNLAAATSTGGMTNKMWGRVGDTPLIGAGTYASNHTCAVSATGHGEYFIRATVARDIAALMEYGGLSLAHAARRKVHEDLTGLGGHGGIIAVDRLGNLSLVFNSSGMYRGWLQSDEPPRVAIFESQ